MRLPRAFIAAGSTLDDAASSGVVATLGGFPFDALDGLKRGLPDVIRVVRTLNLGRRNGPIRAPGGDHVFPDRERAVLALDSLNSNLRHSSQRYGYMPVPIFYPSAHSSTKFVLIDRLGLPER